MSDTKKTLVDARFPWDLAILACFALCVVCVMQSLPKMSISSGDPDDALRLVQFRTFMSNGNWYDFHIAKLAPPDGYVSHWSRIPDAMMAVLFRLATVFVAPSSAELFARALYPLLWFFPAFLSASAVVYAILKQRLAIIALCILVGSSPGMLTEFASGRIDHRGAQIALSVVVISCAALAGRNLFIALLAGFAAALSLAIGLEGLLYVVVGAAVFGIRYIVDIEFAKHLRCFCASLAVSSILALATLYPPTRWSVTACDALASNYVVSICCGCLLILVASMIHSLRLRVAGRLFGLAVGAVVAAALFVWIDPACLGGPFKDISPELKIRWLDTVREMQPMAFWRGGEYLSSFLPLLVSLVPAAIGSVWLVSKSQYRSNPAFLTLVVVFAISLVFAVATVRFIFYTQWLAVAIYCCVVFEMYNRLRANRALAIASCVSAFLPMLIFSAANLAVASNKSGAAKSDKTGCLKDADFAALAKMSAGHVLSPVDAGSFVLALTDHSVTAAPYHRLGSRMLDVIYFFDEMSNEAGRRYVVDNAVDYVVICPDYSPYTVGATGFTPIHKQLLQSHPPDWLEAVSSPVEGPMRIFRVKPQP